MDWKMMARAQGLELGDKDMDRIAGPLAKLEEAFRPLAATLMAEMEPDTALRLGEGGE